MSSRVPSRLDRELAAFLKARMEEAGWSYAKMGQVIGVSGSTVHRIIAGDRSVTLFLLAQIQKTLSVSLSDIFNVSKKS